VLGAHSPTASQISYSGNSHGYLSFSDVLKRASEFPEVVPVMFAAPRESRRSLLAATYPLVFASPELKHSASVFLNSSFSFLGHSLYGSRPGTKKDFSSVSSVTALVDSGADVQILSYEDALKMFLDVRPSAL
jgi:hypothetical protein